MFKTIEKIREKPNKTKKQIAFLVAFAFAGIIFVIWLSVVYPSFKQTQENEEKVVSLTPSPISGFMASISSGFSAIGDQFASLKGIVDIFSSDPTHYSATSTTSISQ